MSCSITWRAICGALYVVGYMWCGIRGAVLLGRKHERSEASRSRGMRGPLRGQRARRPTPQLRGQRPRRTAPPLRGQRPRRTAPPLRGLRASRPTPHYRPTLRPNTPQALTQLPRMQFNVNPIHKDARTTLDGSHANTTSGSLACYHQHSAYKSVM